MKIVALVGPSSAGKTTLCEELAVHHQWKVASQDDFGARVHQEARAASIQNPFRGVEDFFTRFFDDALKHSYGPEDSLVLDIVPSTDDSPAIISDLLRQRADLYKEQHPDQSVELFVVLAQCSPQALSQRIQQRNREAEKSGDLQNKREGLFPFEQLTQLVNARPEELVDTTPKMAPLSRADVFNIVDKHFKPKDGEDIRSAPLLIVDTVDPLLFQPDHTPLTPPIVAAKPLVMEYHRLAAKFGFFKDTDNQIQPQVSKNMDCDVVLDTSKDSAAILATHLIEKIDTIFQARTENERSSANKF